MPVGLKYKPMNELTAHAFPKPRLVETNGIRLAVHELGEGRPVVLLHGFPELAFSWRHQLPALAAAGYRAIAPDLRGYGGSDKPGAVKAYAIGELTADVTGLLDALGLEQAMFVGHDWGGSVAWNVAMRKPEITELLIVCNLPHPAGIAREVATNPEQKKNSEYAFNFQKPDAHKVISLERLTQWVTDPAARPRYLEAFQRSDVEAMLNYYKANYPKPDTPPPPADFTFPKVKAPVLMFHGLEDQALLPGALNGTWQWVEKDLTIMTIPGASHFVQQDAADMVSDTMVDWLARRVRK